MSFQQVLFFTTLTIALVACRDSQTDEREIEPQSVSAVIGDVSYVSAFGTLPDEHTDEDLRLQTHLAYVEQLLRQKQPADLSPEQLQQREYLLNLLAQYHQEGTFPRNYDYPDQRMPCFIDRDGRICAVGYLIEQTAGRDVAEAINDKYQYAYLNDMHDPSIDSWIAHSGLTREECAMIQPAYFTPPITSKDYSIDANYAIASSALSGVNAAMNAANAIQMFNCKSTSNAAPIAGMITGAGQLTLGIIRYPDDYLGIGTPVVRTTKRNVSMLNIGIGAGTLIISTWNLLSNREPKQKSLSWNVFGMPAPDQTTALGIGFTKRF